MTKDHQRVQTILVFPIRLVPRKRVSIEHTKVVPGFISHVLLATACSLTLYATKHKQGKKKSANKSKTLHKKESLLRRAHARDGYRVPYTLG